MAQQVAQRRQSGGRTIAKVAEGLPWSLNGGTVVATVIAQWTLSVGQRRHNGGARKAEALLKLIHSVHNSTYFLRGDQWPTTVHPFCHNGDVCAFLLPPSSDLWAIDLFGDCFEHAQNFTATMASMAMFERPVYHHWAIKATVLPPFCLQRRPGQFCGRTMEAERSQPLCKGGISNVCVFFMSKSGTPLTKFGCVTPYPRGCFKEAILRTAK